MTVLTIAGWVGLGLVVLIWLGNLTRVLRARKDQRYRLTVERYPEARPSGRVSVIIPARNEEANIEACVRAVAGQDHRDLEIIAIDDRSEDATGELLAALAAEEPRLTVVAGDGPPPGWTGKVAACWRGQAVASGETLLFVDADVRLAPETLRLALAYLEESGADGVTLIGRLVTEGFWEWVVQPVVGSLILAGNRPEEVNDPQRPKSAMANGQFIMVRRSAYDAVGGHEAVRGEVLDDVGFARLMKARQRSLHLLLGLDLMSVRMYTGLREIWDGWTKNLFLGLHRSLPLTLLVWMAVFATGLLPFLLAAGLPALTLATGQPGFTDPAWWLSVAAAILIWTTYAVGLQRTRHEPLHFWSYPLGVVVLLGILANSALRALLGLGVHWKGRRITDLGSGHPELDPARPTPPPATPPKQPATTPDDAGTG